MSFEETRTRGRRTSSTSSSTTEPIGFFRHRASSQSADKMNIDEIFSEIGELGRQQWKYVFMVSLLRMYIPFNLLSYAFVAREMSFVCVTDAATNGTAAARQNVILHNKCPGDDDSSLCTNVAFDTTREETGIVSDWSLVCDSQWLVPLTMSLFLLGFTFGMISIGALADQRGRKYALFFSLAGIIISNHAAVLNESFWLYCFLRATNGFFCAGLTISLLLMYNELVGSSKRGLAAAIYSSGWALGVILLSLLANYVRHWRKLQFAITLVGLPLAMFYFWLPESPRWLQTKNRLIEANAVIKKIAQGNGVRYKDEYTLKSLDSNSSDTPSWSVVRRGGSSGVASANNKSKALEETSLWVIWQHRSLTLMTITLIYSWFAIVNLYYGLTLIAGTDIGDLYFGTAVSGMIEVPADFFGSYLMTYYGRRNTVCGFLLSGGVCLLAVFFESISSPLAIFVLLMFSKMCASTSLALFPIHTNELYPTAIRGTAIGLVCVISRFGDISCPYLVQLGALYPNLHYLLFGLMALSSGALNWMFLPETSGRPLPEKVEDILQTLSGRK